MKIELEEKDMSKVEGGDIVKFNDDVIAIVTDSNKVFLLKFPSERDWFDLEGGAYNDKLKEGKFKVLAKADEWKISRI